MNKWESEPDEWSGEMMYAVRHLNTGHWCGYVGVSEGHPYFGRDYDDLNALNIQVHGGLTYAKDHKPMHAPDGLWWFGFDCAHLGDKLPFMNFSFPGDTYRDFEYTQQEVINLATQLARLANPKELLA